MAIYHKIDREVKASRAVLDHKRQVALLLETLAHKEDIRLQRFSEIRVLVDELRNFRVFQRTRGRDCHERWPFKLSSGYTRRMSGCCLFFVQSDGPSLDAPCHRIHTLRLSRQPPAPDLAPSLRAAVAKQLSLPEDDPSVQKMVYVILPHLSKIAPSEINSVIEPGARHKHNAHTTAFYRYVLLNTTLILMNCLRLCLQRERHISVFLRTRSPYPSRLRMDNVLIDDLWPCKGQQRADFIASTLKPLEDDIEQPALVGKAGLLYVLKPSSFTFVAKHEESTSKADEYASTLLERKAKKVEQAERLVRDVQRYIKMESSLRE
ncbi:hypothetical protein IMY05_C4580000100 [Salix suchowensis]|nr:hypothetical protein IMY05_C4580000100 [Salix suchowensis]